MWYNQIVEAWWELPALPGVCRVSPPPYLRPVHAADNTTQMRTRTDRNPQHVFSPPLYTLQCREIGVKNENTCFIYILYLVVAPDGGGRGREEGQGSEGD
ncbi:hypothetical protein Pmani_002875 [Petrolisthes manimaculis]|uniref:Uncharacterized protein n=1 Tax=Petrolisthes manimaculis TaxID=1843537 RepID=A0AAE1QJL2_9EUCA|nr:hypothetical protein Pmani_002875 [Petrolisthes manimaculis]